MGQLRSQLSPRLLLLALLVAGFSFAWQRLNQIPLLVVGQPAATGLLQRDREAPFFAKLQASTGLPIKVEYKRVDQIGFKDVYQLQALKDGTFDLVSLRFIQNSQAEPGLLGIDLPGVIQDHDTARKVVAAYAGTLDRHLQERFHRKLLGVWSFGAQELFCRKPINHLSDMKGLKVRVASQSLATLVAQFGASPVVIPFEETRSALAIGLVDCAITSAQSANSAGWPEYAAHSFPIAFQFGLNGYAISLAKWNAMTEQQRRILAKTFDDYIAELWVYSAALQADAKRCHTGGDCRWFKPYKLQRVEPSASDIQQLRQIMLRHVFPDWAAACDRMHPGCSRDWQTKLGAYVSTPSSPR